MHRELQVIQAAAAAIEAETDIAAMVYANRDMSLSQEDQELPAVVVRGGGDSPFTEWDDLNPTVLNSRVELRVMAYAVAGSEADLAAEIARLRAVVHRALYGEDRSLGLAFVKDTIYGGAEQMNTDTNAGQVSGARTFMFTVHYQMNLTNPE